MICVKINGNEYEAEITGLTVDDDWDGRESKTIYTSQISYAEAMEWFIDNCGWSIVCYEEAPDNNGGLQTIREEFDNSGLCVAGPITNFRDGRIAIKMGTETELEQALKLLYGGNE